jgi:hypothetical protein
VKGPNERNLWEKSAYKALNFWQPIRTNIDFYQHTFRLHLKRELKNLNPPSRKSR